VVKLLSTKRVLWKTEMKYLLLTLVMLVNTALAGEVAMVVALKGDVYSNQIKVKQGSPIHEGDIIDTLDRSFAVIQFFDGSKVTVRPESQMIINSFKEDQVELDLVAGGLRIVTGAISKNNPDNYNVKTPVALMGVRGTEFSVQIVD
jgi:hypothetical protein